MQWRYAGGVTAGDYPTGCLLDGVRHNSKENLERSRITALQLVQFVTLRCSFLTPRINFQHLYAVHNEHSHLMCSG